MIENVTPPPPFPGLSGNGDAAGGAAAGGNDAAGAENLAGNLADNIGDNVGDNIGGEIDGISTAEMPAQMPMVPPADDGKAWYALHVTSGFEKHVREGLQERIERYNMQESFGEILLPIGKRLEIRRGKKKEVEEKMFPGYLFVQMNMMPETWHLVRKTRWVNGFIGGSPDEPRALSHEEVSNIYYRIGGGGAKPVLRAKFVDGESVRIKDGPFSDFTGVAEAVNMERERLTVSVMVFGRSTPVELDFDQVEKI